MSTPHVISDDEMGAPSAVVGDDDMGAPSAGPVMAKHPAAPFIPESSATSTLGAGVVQGAKDLAQPFVDIGKGAVAANDFATRALNHPVDTFGGGKAGAVVREGMRGVNSNIPFANAAVEKLGGPAAESEEDAANAPGARALGSVAGIPVGNMVGGIASKAVETAAPMVGRALTKIAKGANERNVVRASEGIEAGAYKRNKAMAQTDVVEDVVRAHPEIQRAAAAGDDTKLAAATASVRSKATADLGKIYSSAAPEIDMAVPVMKMDARIADLMKGTSTDAATGRQLQKIRDELNDRFGSRDAVSPRELRDEQTAFQKKAYGKAMPGDEPASTNIAAATEAQKAVGDAVFEHVTGMDYEAAKAAAERDPNGLAARLLKANDTVNATNKIDATIADRAARPQTKTGIGAALSRIAHHATAPLVMGASHGPGAAAMTAVAQEALHAAPGAIRATARGIDRALPVVAGAGERGATKLATALADEGAATPSNPSAVGSEYRASVRRLAELARKARTITSFVPAAVSAGFSPADARRIYSAAHPGSTDGDVALAAPTLAGAYRVAGEAPGMIEPGNIDLKHRPDVRNADGTHSSVRSMSFEENGQEILIPTVPEDGSHIMSDDEAIEQYHRTGKFLGKFKNPDAATQYAERLHEQQAGQMRL